MGRQGLLLCDNFGDPCLELLLKFLEGRRAMLLLLKLQVANIILHASLSYVCPVPSV